MNAAETIQALELSVNSLLARYQEALRQIDELEEANGHQREELIRTHAELVELQESYRALQTAHALSAGTPERAQAKKHLAAIISKVDKTLELLKE
jgi:hypothetical protein